MTPATPALILTEHYREITWLGHMTARKEPGIDGVAVEALELGFDGLDGAPYGGRKRPSCSRVKAQHPKGTEIANVRQLSIVSAEELEWIMAEMELEHLDPAWLGATVVVRGIPDFTPIPPSAQLQTKGGKTLFVDMVNLPCHQPGLAVKRHYADAGKLFKAAAKDRWGVTAWVERSGPLRIGDRLRLHIPAQRGWAPDAA